MPYVTGTAHHRWPVHASHVLDAPIKTIISIFLIGLQHILVNTSSSYSNVQAVTPHETMDAILPYLPQHPGFLPKWMLFVRRNPYPRPNKPPSFISMYHQLTSNRPP